MVYDMLEKYYRGQDQVEYCIPVLAGRFFALHFPSDIHDIEDIGGRLYADVREAELEPV